MFLFIFVLVMAKDIGKFRFKRFAVSHSRSSMRVGVDGVAIGCFAPLADESRILDVGTGCGVVALILAQRCETACIDAIDVDCESVDEACENFRESPFSDRLRGFIQDYMAYSPGRIYSHIISNPPFFNSGVKVSDSVRISARHQIGMTLSALVEHSALLLTEGGRLSMVIPVTELSKVLEAAESNGFFSEKLWLMRGHKNAPWKRVLLTLRYGLKCKEERSEITMFGPDGSPTEEYRELCKDFYIKF